MGQLLEVNGLSVSYGAIAALNDVSLAVDGGEAVAILGANGAGKTTLLRCLSGLIGKRSGSIIFDGVEVSSLRPAQRVKLGIVHVPEGRQLFSRLTVFDNLRLGGYASFGAKPAESDMAYLFELFPRLAERRNQLAGTLSGGEQQMLAISRALLARPRLLMLDEPSMGLSPVLISAIYKVLAEINEKVTILVVEQNVRAALGLAKRGYLLESGAVVAKGPAADLTDESIKAAYLGR